LLWLLAAVVTKNGKKSRYFGTAFRPRVSNRNFGPSVFGEIVHGSLQDVSHFIHSSPGRDIRACDEGHRRREDTELNMECRAAREVRPISASFACQHSANVYAMAQISITQVTYADLCVG
jgi:hypothetical protein